MSLEQNCLKDFLVHYFEKDEIKSELYKFLTSPREIVGKYEDFEKRKSKECPTMYFGESEKHGFCWCCRSSTSHGVRMIVKGINKKQKQIFFDMEFYQDSDEGGDWDFGWDYECTTTLTLDYKYKYAELSSLCTKFDGNKEDEQTFLIKNSMHSFKDMDHFIYSFIITLTKIIEFSS